MKLPLWLDGWRARLAIRAGFRVANRLDRMGFTREAAAIGKALQSAKARVGFATRTEGNG